ncbi:MAG: ribosome maturation factor RimP [Arsenophonus endosymbiont of Ceratovacuna japonica]
MSILEKKLTSMISVLVESLNFEFIGLEFIRARISILRVYIDNKNNLTINDCAIVSYKINNTLDFKNLILNSYNLEVSSPGLERPLFTIEHYQSFIGRKVKLILRKIIYNHRKYQGIIKNVDNKIITVTVDNKDEVFILEDIKKANLVF